ncbi:hypothetical protein APR41_17835 [Salegentibacter salinarum]|uniref:Uncharacterized protein n=1 Tax=Salegentibacter salinarum TaxID=447422 RepID=A0A2N0TV85_9FLAO|nr:hypothetical protein [Salegentibacter salinarum]PKD18657.1 hypothetical protein APR41_17835 [Salegentibacter salinarum]SKB99051.1 hypothetical protein SAMN05660903_03676 [Salegentibacter salinarum]
MQYTNLPWIIALCCILTGSVFFHNDNEVIGFLIGILGIPLSGTACLLKEFLKEIIIKAKGEFSFNSKGYFKSSTIETSLLYYGTHSQFLQNSKIEEISVKIFPKEFPVNSPP